MSCPVAEGIEKHVIVQGITDSSPPKHNDKVFIHFSIRLLDGTQIQNTDQSMPFSFRIGSNRVIPGMELVVLSMVKGEICLAVLHHQHAFGVDGVSGVIPPQSSIEVEVTLVDIDTNPPLPPSQSLISLQTKATTAITKSHPENRNLTARDLDDDDSGDGEGADDDDEGANDISSLNDRYKQVEATVKDADQLLRNKKYNEAIRIYKRAFVSLENIDLEIDQGWLDKEWGADMIKDEDDEDGSQFDFLDLLSKDKYDDAESASKKNGKHKFDQQLHQTDGDFIKLLLDYDSDENYDGVGSSKKKNIPYELFSKLDGTLPDENDESDHDLENDSDEFDHDDFFRKMDLYKMNDMGSEDIYDHSAMIQAQIDEMIAKQNEEYMRKMENEQFNDFDEQNLSDIDNDDIYNYEESGAFLGKAPRGFGNTNNFNNRQHLNFLRSLMQSDANNSKRPTKWENGKRNDEDDDSDDDDLNDEADDDDDDFNHTKEDQETIALLRKHWKPAGNRITEVVLGKTGENGDGNDGSDDDDYDEEEDDFDVDLFEHYGVPFDYDTEDRDSQDSEGDEGAISSTDKYRQYVESTPRKQVYKLQKKVLNELSLCYNQQGKFSESIRRATESLEIDHKDNADAFFQRGKAFLARGYRDRARKDFEKAARIRPSDDNIKKQLEILNAP